MSMDICVEAGMATNFQSASQSALAKVLRFANVDIEKETKNTADHHQQKDFMFIVGQAFKYIWWTLLKV